VCDNDRSIILRTLHETVIKLSGGFESAGVVLNTALRFSLMQIESGKLEQHNLQIPYISFSDCHKCV